MKILFSVMALFVLMYAMASGGERTGGRTTTAALTCYEFSVPAGKIAVAQSLTEALGHAGNDYDLQQLAKERWGKWPVVHGTNDYASAKSREAKKAQEYIYADCKKNNYRK